MARAFLFPGQGSQEVGMAKSLFDAYLELKNHFENADSVSGLEVLKAMFEGPEEQLKQTQITQPALYVHSLAVFKMLRNKGIEADFFAGHSLGEFSALAAAGVFSYEDGLKLVSKRGALMSEAREGAMAAILGLADEDVITLCKGIDDVWPANFNSEGQVVISGSPEGIAKATALAREKGAKRALPLAVSGAFHTPFMQKAAAEFRTFMEGFEFKAPQGKVIPNVTGEPTRDPQEIRKLLGEQLTSPVRWTKTMQTLASLDVTEAYELGPGKVLCGLAKRGIAGAACSSIGTAQEIDSLNL
ncbi:ACP S-malonyltransferase [bacterium]|nr:ACP S-malonyltransferase [bacterium]